MDTYCRCLSTPMTVYTDHKSLESMFRLNNQLINDVLNNYAETIMSYNFEIRYVKGITNVILDLLSRMFVIQHERKLNFDGLPEIKNLSIDVDESKYTLEVGKRRVLTLHENTVCIHVYRVSPCIKTERILGNRHAKSPELAYLLSNQ